MPDGRARSQNPSNRVDMGVWKELKDRVAVVTGASSGIGLCFCRELARHGCNLVMVSNQPEQLDFYSKEIARDSGVKTYMVNLDLTENGCADRLIEFIDSNNISIDYLINNAGIFSFKPVSETSERKIDCFLKLHVEAVTALSRRFAMRFKEQGRGRILNMSSMSCWMPMPGIALYSATKAYIRVFSRALHYEMRDYGVTVTVACPGGIATDLFGLPEPLKRLAVRIGALATPEQFVKGALKRMVKGKKQYINGMLNRVSIVFVSIMPTGVRMLVKRKMLDRGIER